MRPLLILALLTAGPPAALAADSPATARADLDFFEKDVRPLLVARCQECHGSEKAKGGLRLDSRASALSGGDTGPAIIPGDPGESLLIGAINHSDVLRMPPKSKLPDAEIAILTRWVAMGAPWPAGDRPPPNDPDGGGIDLEERAKHWSFQRVRDPRPPAVEDVSWPLTEVDRFILEALEARGLTPAEDADRRTLIRRLTFDLTGLPPTPAEVDAFLADRAPDAYETVVDRLLASPHHGERWARHWLDLVRYAETAGHEFDYDIPDAFRYRDYVIRAFNADLPYDEFVVEHIAGDLLERPRRHPTEGFDESILGTGFFALGEGVHSPVDLREDAARRVDNQIDVLSKTFLGLTVACARCHDHKFDPIRANDYYALAGYLKSSRLGRAFIDPPDRIGARVAELEEIKARLKAILVQDGPRPDVGPRVAAYLQTAGRVDRDRRSLPGLAEADGLDEATLGRWVEAIRDPRARASGHPLHAWVALADLPDERWTARRREVLEALGAGREGTGAGDRSVLFEDFRSTSYAGWFVSGDAFGAGPSRPGDIRIPGVDASPHPVATVVPPGLAHSGLVSDRLRGALRSRAFPIRHKFIHYLAAGRAGRINLVVDGFGMIRAPIYGGLTIAVDRGDRARWYTQDVSMWAGHRAYIEIADGATVSYTGKQAEPLSGDGFVAVDEIRFSDDPQPPGRPDRFAAEVLGHAEVDSPAALAGRIGREVDAILGLWRAGRLGEDELDAERVTILAGLLDSGLIRLDEAVPPGADRPPEESPGRLLTRYREVEATIPEPNLAPALADGTGEDERIHLRGNPRSPGEVVPRRYLEVLAGADQPAPASGSGRLELARRMVDPGGPLLARVMVNRLWKHHFGEGLVKSTDDFGAMGEPPSHSELLDYLASRFVAEGWSIKRMHRLMVLSRTYRMRSVADPAADRADPDNRLLHRMNVRRLEAEAIRDSILAVSGRLDRALYGPGVPPHLTPFMDGRGRPEASGPLDGRGRRSLYINVRRNFLSPMFLAFDFPIPASTIGRRNVSNVPAQSLTLMNDPFVLEQARHWADRLLARPGGSPESRVLDLYLAAFGRPPTDRECAGAMAFLEEGRGLGDDPEGRLAWADLCHVLFNAKEFIFIE